MMVGVPGKSKGCHTCRRRKVRCDETVPLCKRCQKAGLDCEGYQRLPVFLNRNANGLMRRQPLEEAVSTARKLETEASLHQHLDLTPAWRQRIEEFFLQHFLPNGHTVTTLTPAGYVFEIISTVPRTDLQESTVSALCWSRVGRINKDDRLLQQGWKAYNSSIRRLQLNILKQSAAYCQPNPTEECALFISAKLMNLYEFYEPSYVSGQAVYDHTKGIDNLIHNNSVIGTSQSRVMKALLKSSRYNSMIACAKCLSKDSPLATFAAVPTGSLSFETLEHTLIDIGFEISAIAQDYSRLCSQIAISSVDHLPDISTLVMKCYKGYSNLENWYTKLVTWCGCSPFWTDRSAVDEESNNILPLMFYNVPVAHRMIDYWVLKIIFIRIIEDFVGYLGAKIELHTYSRPQGSPTLHEIASMKSGSTQQCGVNILAATDYCSRKDFGLSGKDHLFGLGVALKLFCVLPGSQARTLQKAAIQKLKQRASEGLRFAYCLLQQARSQVSINSRPCKLLYAPAISAIVQEERPD